MSLRKHGLKAFGLVFLAALSMMALGATGAQAGFLILNASGVASELHATASGEIDLLGSLLVQKLNFEVDCAKFKVTEGLLLNNGVGHGSFLFEECLAYEIENKITKVKLTLLKNCKVYETEMKEELGLEPGFVNAEALFLVIKHEFEPGKTKTEILAHPKEGSTIFATLWFSELCPVPLRSPVSGLLTLEVHLGGHQVKQLLREALPKLKLGTLTFGEGGGAHEAQLDGAVWVFLTGAHEGLKWGIC